jgi:CRISPR-associated endonuclease/helicase Cas3
VFVVATQCLEVGADLDFDAIVTECASIDAILQRFGRLDRIGQLSSLGGAAEGCIVAAGPATQAGFEDPVYGKALAATWNWLQGCEGLDFALVREEGESIRERLAAMGEAASELRKQDVISPVLLPAHLDLLVQTSPAPALEPDIALFLHGLERGAPEVQVVWRGDLDLGRTEDWAEIVGMCPPVAAEAMPATLRDFRAWISGGDAAGLADVEGTAEAEEATGERLRCPVLVWQGEDSWVVDRLEDVGRIPAWTTVVLATESEGWDELGHKPRDAAGDVAEAARAMLRRGTVVRLHPALIEKWPESDGRGELLEKVKGQDLDADEAVELLQKCSGLDWLTTMLAKPGKPGLERYPGKDSEVVGWILRWPSAEADAGGDESSSGGAVFLDKHLEDVGREVADLAGELIPGERERGALVRAARLHDVGKADVRFQARLRGGDLLAAQFATKMLAKGIVARRDGKAVDGSGLPKGFRHELLSLLLAQKDEGAAGDELALHLIASHHGRCRPFAPVVPDEGVDAAHGGLRIGRREREERAAHRLDSGVADRFWRLTRRYGWWGLAWLEAVLRLGDWKASKEEVEKQS